MRPIWRIFQRLKYYPKEIVLNVLFNTTHVVFNLSSYVLIVPFVELLFGQGREAVAPGRFALDQQTIADWMRWYLYECEQQYGLGWCLIVVSAGYLGCSLIANVCRYMGLYYIGPIRQGMIQRLRDDIYQKTTILPVSYFNSRRRGDILSRMSNDLADVEWSIVTAIQSAAKDIINILLFAATLIFISGKLFCYFLIVTPLLIFMIGKIGKSLKRNSQEGQSKLGHLFAILEESLTAMRVIKAFGQEKERSGRFAEANEAYTQAMVRVAQRRELSAPLSEVMGTIGLVAILVIGGRAVMAGELLTSVFIFFVIVFARLVPPIQSIVRTYNNIQKGNASGTRIMEILDADERIIQKPEAIVVRGFEREIRYEQVGFSYVPDGAGQQPVKVLEDINLTIEKGTTLAIVGPSGAGKTTMVDLLPRFYDCLAGRITFDGHDLRDLDIASLREQVGLVTQNCILFNDTIANNIAFGHESHSAEAVRQAAAAAYAEGFIKELPQGYNTIIGDRGLTLSGGQRQRLSIARALLKNPPILILDEATSALDTESELAVQQALTSLMDGRTSIIIAHRLSTIQKADQIVVMDHGHIVEKGTHSQLIQIEGGLYRKLVETQMI